MSSKAIKVKKKVLINSRLIYKKKICSFVDIISKLIEKRIKFEIFLQESLVRDLSSIQNIKILSEKLDKF